MRKIIIILSLLIVVATANAQSQLHQYHMKGNTVIGQELNATFFPKSKFYISLPAISNINLYLNSPLSYSDIFTKVGDSTRVNVNELLADGKDHHFFEAATTVPVLGFGFRLNERSTFSFFSNVKNSLAIGVPYDLIRLAWNGNGAFIGEEYEIDDLRINVLSYAEVGIGYSRDVTIAGQAFKIGGRLKYLAGIGSARINNESTVGLAVDETTYRNTLLVEDASLLIGGANKADLELEDIEELSGDGGFAVDIGAQYDFSEKWNFSFALNDLGQISWKKKATEIKVAGGSIELEGVDLNDVDDLGEELETQFDTLTSLDTINTTFNSPLRTSMFLGAEYKVTKSGTAFATYSNYFSLGKLRTAIGVGYQQEVGRVLAVSATVLKVPQRGIDLGAGMSLRLGFLHLHFSAGGIGSMLDVTQARGVNVNFGMNFLFGKSE